MKKILKLLILTLVTIFTLTGCQLLQDEDEIKNKVDEQATLQEDIEGTVVTKRTTDKTLESTKEGENNENKQTN